MHERIYMTFKIKHEKISILILLIFSFLLLSVLSFDFVVKEKYLLLFFSLILQLLLIVMFIIEQTTRTIINVDDEKVTIKHLFVKKRLDIKQISNIQTERYKRMHKNHFKECRMRMTIRLYNGQKVVLNDTAMKGMGTIGVLTLNSNELPDEEIELYKAYQSIIAKLNLAEKSIGCRTAETKYY